MLWYTTLLMPYKKNYKKRSKKGKWRQQKLAIGTVQKIAKQIAKKLDDKNIIFYYNNIPHTADGFTWDSVTELPTESAYRPIQQGALESQIMSELANVVNVPGHGAGGSVQNRVNLQIAIKACEARLIFQNINTCPVRVVIQIVFIPNLNEQTDDAVDFLRPDVFMLYKRGSGNLLYDGLAKQGIANKSTGAASVRKYQIISSKTITVPACNYRAAQIEDAQTPPTAGTMMRDVASASYRRVTLTKYFKRERKHNCKYRQAAVGPQLLTDGSYYLIIHSDISADDDGPRAINYAGATTMKFRVVGGTDQVSP